MSSKQELDWICPKKRYGVFSKNELEIESPTCSKNVGNDDVTTNKWPLGLSIFLKKDLKCTGLKLATNIGSNIPSNTQFTHSALIVWKEIVNWFNSKDRMPHFGPPSPDIFVLVYSKNHATFVVGGEPVPKKRAGRTVSGRSYNPSQRLQEEFAQVVARQFQLAIGKVPFYGEGVNLRMEIELNFTVSGRSKEQQERSLRAKGDVDNFAKFVQDALQGTMYVDDKQIVEVKVKKTGWATTGRGHTYVGIFVEDRPVVVE